MTKVLIIDDDDLIRERLQKLLALEGYTALSANDGETGLAIFDRESPEVILLDIKMPGMDGMKVLERIKERSAAAEVIMITGHGETESAVDALRKNAFDYITKPLNFDELVISIQRALEKQKMIDKGEELMAGLQAAAEADRVKAEDLKKALSELEKTQVMLIQAGKMTAMGQLAAGVAHELNQPLTTIRGYSQMIEKEMSQDDSKKDLFKKIVAQTDRMRKIIESLRAFAKASVFDYKDMDINACIEESLSLLRSQLESHDIDITLELQTSLPPVYGDFNQLQQVFINLISNARDALDSIKDGKNKQVRICSRLIKDEKGGDDSTEILIRDTGPGIPEKHRSEIFNPFFTTKKVGEGIGLGLSISHGIIEDHAGTIELLPERDRGSTFRIVLSGAGTARSKSIGKKRQINSYVENFDR